MKWQVTQTTDSVHVGILIAASPGYTKASPPRCILGLHPENVLQDIPVGENLAMAETFGINSLGSITTIQKLILEPQTGFILLRPGGGI